MELRKSPEATNTLTVRYSRPKVSPDQAKLLDTPARFTFCGAGTKTGKTVAGAIWILEGLLQGMRCAWIGPWFKRTKTGYEHVKSMLRDFEKAGIAKTRDTDLTIDVFQTTTGRPGRLECFSGDSPDSVYGDAFNRIFLDEATRQPEAIFPSARSTTTATGGSMIIAFNTDRSPRHWAIREFLRAKRGEEPTYGYVTMPTSASPYVPKEDVAQAKRILPDRIFRALYNAEVFEDGASVFEDPRACMHGSSQFDKPQHGVDYCMGVDLARKADYTVVCVFNRRTRRLVQFRRWYGLPWAEQRRRIADLAREYNNARVVVDATGLGDPNVEELVRDGLSVDPFIFSQPSKRELIERLIVALEQKLISFPANTELDVLMHELEYFEYETTAAGNLVYGSADNEHDDCVMALALAVRGLGPISPLAARGVERVRLGDSDTADSAWACL
jgi:hypothetical protein